MKNSKSPGNDVFTTEFFSDLGFDLMDCLNSNFEVGELTTSQRHQLSLIAKPGKDITSLKS